MLTRLRSSAATLLLVAALLVSQTVVGASRARSVAFAEARARRTPNYIGPEDAAVAHRKLMQLPKGPSVQIFLDGIIEAASLDQTCDTSALCGGSMTINGIVVTVPKNLIALFPANALTWQEIFNGGTTTGLAKSDPGAIPGVAYTAAVAANRVGNQIIAAFIDIAQDPVVVGSGYIDAIDYKTGTLTIETLTGKGAKVRLNDPSGRYGIPQTGLDDRFQCDSDNPTIRASTGFPMCIPRTDPAAGDDPLCPVSTQRSGTPPPTIITMNTPGNNPDPLKMVPFMVGDYITYAGVLTPSGDFAAYEVVGNLAIFTRPQVDPAYTVFEAAIIGTGGLNALGAGEAAIRTVFEGFTTDPTRPIQMWALDFSPADGTYTKRDLGQTMPDPGAGGGGVKGRWRFRPACTNTGPLTVGSPFLGNKGCTPPPDGTYLPPPREVMADITGCATVAGAANGITSGDGPAAHGGCMYRNPAIEYLWPEFLAGTPVPELNFGAFPFLVRGGYTSSKGTLVGGLDPFPSNVVPATSCVAPTISIPTTFTVPSGGTVALSATVTGPSSPFTFHWTALSANGGTSPDSTQLSTTFTPVTADSATVASTQYTLTVTNICGTTASATTTVAVTAAAGTGVKQTLQAIGPATFSSGSTTASLTANLAAGTGAFTWTLPAGFAKGSQTPAAATPAASSKVVFSVPVIATGGAAIKAQVSVTGGTSAPTLVDVTVTPPTDTPTIATASFRCDKKRLTLTANTNVVDPNLQLTLQPYKTNAATSNTDAANIFNPGAAGVFLNVGNGGYTLQNDAWPMPSTHKGIGGMVVKSSAGGVSNPPRILLTTEIIKGPCSI